MNNGKNRLFSQFNKVAFYYNAEAITVSSKKFPENGAKPVVSPEIRPTEQKNDRSDDGGSPKTVKRICDLLTDPFFFICTDFGKAPLRKGRRWRSAKSHTA